MGGKDRVEIVSGMLGIITWMGDAGTYSICRVGFEISSIFAIIKKL